MRNASIVLAIGVLLLAGVTGQIGAAGAATPSAPEFAANDAPLPNGSTANDSRAPRITGLAPDPIAYGDAGEYVAVSIATPTNTTGWTVVDEAGTVARLPNRTIEGRVVLTRQPGAVGAVRTATIHEIQGGPRLANGGDAVELRRPNGSVVSRVSYDDTTEGERYRRTAGGWEWRVPGATDFAPVRTTPESARTFVLPDSPNVVASSLRNAEERIYLAGYTLTSRRVTDALLAANDRGVEVRVLLEGSPVGGTSQRQYDALDRLSAVGVPVTVLGGERDPFGVHHAKYAVIDDRALVLTENFKPAGTGGHSSRGWGAIVRGEDTAGAFATVFRADSTGPGSRNWTDYRSTVDPVPGGASSETYPTHFQPRSVPVNRATVLVAPDNARSEVEALLRSANESIRIQQMEIEGFDDPLLQASIDAARNGTEVEILLSSASYVETQNRNVVMRVERLARREGLPISAELVDPRGRFSKVHGKVAIVDDQHVVLGSLNWNEAAYEENREVVVVLTGEEVARYYASVFEADARDVPLWRMPTGLVGAVCALWILLGLLAIAGIRWAV